MKPDSPTTPEQSGPAVASSDWLAAVQDQQHRDAHKHPICPICGKPDCDKGLLNLEGIVPIGAANILHELGS